MESKDVVAGLAMLSLLLVQAYLLPQRHGAVGGAVWVTAASGSPSSHAGVRSRHAPASVLAYDLRASSRLHAPGPATNR